MSILIFFQTEVWTLKWIKNVEWAYVSYLGFRVKPPMRILKYIFCDALQEYLKTNFHWVYECKTFLKNNSDIRQWYQVNFRIHSTSGSQWLHLSSHYCRHILFILFSTYRNVGFMKSASISISRPTRWFFSISVVRFQLLSLIGGMSVIKSKKLKSRKKWIVKPRKQIPSCFWFRFCIVKSKNRCISSVARKYQLNKECCSSPLNKR